MHLDKPWLVISRWLRKHSIALGMASTLSVCAIVGCGKSAPPAGSAEKEEKSDEEAVPDEEAPKRRKKSDGDGSKVASANPNRKMVADIPYDVFFDNPIAEASQAGEMASPAPATAVAKAPDAAKPAAEPMPAKTEEKPAAAGADGWAAVLSGEDIQDEVKKIRLRLQSHLGAVQQYNSHYNKEIPWDGACLAALANIAVSHPDKISWKGSAGQIRDAAAEMVGKSKALGPKAFEATKKEFEKIDGLLSGNPPPGIPDAAKDVGFSDVASRKYLMNGIQLGTDNLRANFQAEAKFTAGTEEVTRTASIVAAYCKVIGTEGYNSADEPDYQGFLNPLIDSYLKMAKAGRDKDHATFTEAIGSVPKYCSDCHGTYQGAG